ncbi:MAG: CPBP family intramembrane metalloprotease [Bacteroidota bacterium]|nr:CPBP family intramembrane metalloprotease [Bacteroidota bacterium]
MSEEIIQNESEIYQSQETKYKPAAFAFVALLILFVLYQLVGGGLTLLIIGIEINESNVTIARLATMFSQIIFLLVPTILLAKHQHGKLSEIFRWRIPTFRETFLAVIGMLALMQIGEMYLFFQSKIPLPEQIAPFIEAMKKAIEEAYKILIVAHTVPEMLFVVLVAAVTPSICEELMFRGLIQKNFSIAYGNRKGFIVAGMIFAFYHLNPFWLVPLVALGIYFSFLQYRSQTLLLPILAHLINNASATVGVYFYGVEDTTTPTMFMGEQIEPSNVIVFGTALLFMIIFSLIIVQYIKATENVHARVSH